MTQFPYNTRTSRVEGASFPAFFSAAARDGVLELIEGYEFSSSSESSSSLSSSSVSSESSSVSSASSSSLSSLSSSSSSHSSSSVSSISTASSNSSSSSRSSVSSFSSRSSISSSSSSQSPSSISSSSSLSESSASSQSSSSSSSLQKYYFNVSGFGEGNGDYYYNGIWDGGGGMLKYTLSTSTPSTGYDIMTGGSYGMNMMIWLKMPPNGNYWTAKYSSSDYTTVAFGCINSPGYPPGIPPVGSVTKLES